VANTLNAFRGGAVGFIDWLDDILLSPECECDRNRYGVYLSGPSAPVGECGYGGVIQNLRPRAFDDRDVCHDAGLGPNGEFEGASARQVAAQRLSGILWPWRGKHHLI
jgi:hypothetical protein